MYVPSKATHPLRNFECYEANPKCLIFFQITLQAHRTINIEKLDALFKNIKGFYAGKQIDALEIIYCGYFERDFKRFKFAEDPKDKNNTFYSKLKQYIIIFDKAQSMNFRVPELKVTDD